MYYTVENNQEMNFPLDIYFFNMVGNISYNERGCSHALGFTKITSKPL